MQIISRGKGRSAIAAAAYRAGVRLTDQQNNTVHDYANKQGVGHSQILKPQYAAPFLGNRAKLWNHVEKTASRQKAQLAREITLGLPHELNPAQRLELVQQFVQDAFVSRGMVADLNIHAPQAHRSDDPRNHHAHVMLTMRQATDTGLAKTMTREWNSKAELQSWREQWANHQNLALERAGHEVRVDHRSLSRQLEDAKARNDVIAIGQLDREPEIYMGPIEATQSVKLPPDFASETMPLFPRLENAAREARERHIEPRSLEMSTTPPIDDEKPLKQPAERHSHALPKDPLKTYLPKHRSEPVKVWLLNISQGPRPRKHGQSDEDTFERGDTLLKFKMIERSSKHRRPNSDPSIVTRLDANMKVLDENREKAHAWVTKTQIGQTQFRMSWKELSQHIAWLEAHGADPDLVAGLVKRLRHIPKLALQLYQTVAAAKAHEEQTNRRYYQVELRHFQAQTKDRSQSHRKSSARRRSRRSD